ncbi:MAG: ATPase, T2SS/T4P/T4SS family [Pirellulales bacterium]
MEHDTVRAQFRQLIDLPHGIVLVTGPTGSGKTTTLYSCADRDQRRRHQDHHDRRPGRISARRHQPDSGSHARSA